MNNCNICGAEVNLLTGGCALQIAVCREHNANLLNLSYCADCYKNLIEAPLKKLSDAGCMDLILSDEEANND